jgi:nitrate reductase NapE component
VIKIFVFWVLFPALSIACIVGHGHLVLMEHIGI